MTTQTVTHIRGATFSYAGTATLPNGVWTAAAALRNTRGEVVQSLTVTLTAPVAPATAWSITLKSTATSTGSWPLGTLRGDVRFADGSGTVIYTSRFLVNVEEHQTDAPA